MIIVYRLDITYPEGSHEPGWKPSLWTDPVFLAGLPRRARIEQMRRVFSWPAECLFLNRIAACSRVALLRAYGATVDFQPSEPVTWTAAHVA